jgi:hypothetical protein
MVPTYCEICSFWGYTPTATIRSTSATTPPIGTFIATLPRSITAVCLAGDTCTFFSTAPTTGHHRAGEDRNVSHVYVAIDPYHHVIHHHGDCVSTSRSK